MENKQILLTGLLIMGCIFQVLYANPIEDDEYMQSDYYQYDNDEDPPSQSSKQQTNPSSSSTHNLTEKLSFAENDLKLIVQPGGNITLSCPVQNLKVPENHVRIWYKDNNALTTGIHSFKDNFALNSDESLIISNASATIHSGNYYCEIEPEHVRLRINLRVEKLNADTISGAFKFSLSSISITVIGVILFLRIYISH